MSYPENGDKVIKSEPAPCIKSVHQEAESTIYRFKKSGTARNKCDPATMASLYASPLIVTRQTNADRGRLRVIH